MRSREIMKKVITLATAFVFTGIVACSSLMPIFQAAASAVSSHCQGSTTTESKTIPSCDHSVKVDLGISLGKTPSGDDIQLTWELPLDLWGSEGLERAFDTHFVEPPAGQIAQCEAFLHPHRNLILRL